jgi:hypothetical protein
MTYYYNDERGADENIGLALYAIANELNALGLKDAHTRLGALELLAQEVRDGLARVAGALDVMSDGGDRR